MNSWNASTKTFNLRTTDFATYDQVPYYKVFARIRVIDTTTSASLSDDFTIEIIEACRTATISGTFTTLTTMLTPNQL